ncbi:MAG: rhomboid family intramembrane serine protease, partial [Acidobacteriota bacterium]
HILFNMMALRQIGPFITQEYGVHRMFIIYTLSGVFGFWLSYMAGVRFTIGASAALCGLIGAGLYYGKSRGGAFGQQVFVQIRGWVISIFIFGFFFPGINNWGHGGGLAAGIALGYLLGYVEKRPEKLAHKLLAGLCVAVTALVLLWSAGIGIYVQLLSG